MRFRILLLSLLILSVLTPLVVVLGIEKGYFLTIWWWDIPMHILGGAWVACASAYFTFGRVRMTLLLCILAAFSVGVLWELFEYIVHIGGSVFMSYAADTAKDVLDDCIGGAVAYMLMRFI